MYDLYFLNICWQSTFRVYSKSKLHFCDVSILKIYRGADKSLARPGRKQANISVRMAWISFGALPCRKRNLMTARVSILLKPRASLTCFRACFLPGRAKDLSAPRYSGYGKMSHRCSPLVTFFYPAYFQTLSSGSLKIVCTNSGCHPKQNVIWALCRPRLEGEGRENGAAGSKIQPSNVINPTPHGTHFRERNIATTKHCQDLITAK